MSDVLMIGIKVVGVLGPGGLPRLREESVPEFAWQGLVPIALGQLVLTGVVVTVS